MVCELRDMAKQFVPSILCILETQVERTRVESLAGSLGFNNSFAVSSSGRSGGLGIFWNDEIKVEVNGYSQYHIDVLVDDLMDTRIRLMFVYGEAEVPERYKTWDMLRGIAGTNGLPWAVMGDFNEVLHAHEHDGVGNRSQAQVDAFRDALDTCGLVDIAYTGTTWTFEKKVTRGTFTRVRLDCCLVNPGWSLVFLLSELNHRTTTMSDHVPIELRINDVHGPCNRGPWGFKYELTWERDPLLFELVGS